MRGSRRPLVVNNLTFNVSQAGLFSAVSSAFAINVIPSSNLTQPTQPWHSEHHTTFLTLNHSAIPNKPPNVPLVQEIPPTGIAASTSFLYASLLISLPAAFIAMLGKRSLRRYLRRAGGSMVALLLPACGLCRYVTSINTLIAGGLIALLSSSPVSCWDRHRRCIFVRVSVSNYSISSATCLVDEDRPTPNPH